MQIFIIIFCFLVCVECAPKAGKKGGKSKIKATTTTTTTTTTTVTTEPLDFCDQQGCNKTVSVTQGNSLSLVCMPSAEQYGCSGFKVMDSRTRTISKVVWFRLQNSLARPVADELKPCSYVTEMNDFSLTLINVTEETAGSYACIVSVYSADSEFELCDLCTPRGAKVYSECWSKLAVNLTATFHVALERSIDVTLGTTAFTSDTTLELTYDADNSSRGENTTCVSDTSEANWKFAAVYFANKRSDPVVNDYYHTPKLVESPCPGTYSGIEYDGQELKCAWDNIVYFASVNKGDSVILECDIASWVPITRVQWTFRNLSGTTELIDEYTDLGNWLARRQRWSLVLQHVGGMFTWCDVTCEPVWYGKRDSELDREYLRNVTWKIDVVDLDLAREPEASSYALFDEILKDGSTEADFVVKCLMVYLPQHWLRAVVTSYEQNMPNLTEAMSEWNDTLHYTVARHSFLIEINEERTKGKHAEYIYATKLCSHLDLDYEEPPARLLSEFVYINWTVVSRVNPAWHFSHVEQIRRAHYEAPTSPAVPATTALPTVARDASTGGTFGSKVHETIIILTLFLSFGLVTVVTLVAVAFRVHHSCVTQKRDADVEMSRTQRVMKVVTMNVLGGLTNNSLLSISNNPQFRSLQGSSGVYSGDTGASRTPNTSSSCSTLPDEANNEPVCPNVSMEVVGGSPGSNNQVTSRVSESRYEIELDSRWEVPRDTVTVTQDVLGSGEFGCVLAAEVRCGRQNLRAAAKTVKEGATDEELLMLLSELAMLKYINSQTHPNIIALVGCCTQGGSLPIYVLTERASRGSLIGILSSSRMALANCSIPLILTRNHLVELAIQVTRGLCHLAKLMVVHRDLACRNILVMSDFTLKIADFGLTRRSNSSYYSHGDVSMRYRWLAPEALRRLKFSCASDVWALGVVMWEVFTLGLVPYGSTISGLVPLVEALEKGLRLPLPPGVSKDLYSAMLWCWKMDPSHRPQAEELLAVLQSIQSSMAPGQFLQAIGEMEQWGGLAPDTEAP